MKWPWTRRSEPTGLLSIADPAVVGLFTPGGLADLSQMVVGESTALSLAALYRALSLVSGTLASLPLNTWRDPGPDESNPAAVQRERVPSIFDDPDGPDGQTTFEWKETLFLHLMLHGRAGTLKVRNAGGGLSRLPLVHPLSFAVIEPSIDEQADPTKMPAGGLWFDVHLKDGRQVRYDAEDFWYVPAASVIPQYGMSLLTNGRRSLATSIQAEKSAGKTFSNGALFSGLATPSDDTDLSIGGDIDQVRQELNRNALGYEHAGSIVVVNRRLNFTPWTMTAQQAQFLESRQFQIEEIARWTGVPPHLLMQTDKQTSWGTGVDEQNRGLSKFVLGHWANRVEGRGSRLLARPRWVEFDFAGLERPNFAVEIDLLLKQTGGKPILTINEARAVRNLPPVPGGDVLETPADVSRETPPAPPAPGADPQEGDDDPASE